MQKNLSNGTERPVRHSEAEEVDEAPSLNGVWGNNIDVEDAIIDGRTLTFDDGMMVVLNLINPKSFEMHLYGQHCVAELKEDGKLHWNRGDVWCRSKAAYDKREELI